MIVYVKDKDLYVKNKFYKIHKKRKKENIL